MAGTARARSAGPVTLGAPDASAARQSDRL